jgi:hypothetical protein
MTVDRNRTAVTHRPSPDVEVGSRPGVRALPRVTRERVIAHEDVERFYQLYLAAFGPLRARAAARQVLHRSEFLEQMLDPRVWKFVAWDHEDRAVGLTTLTRDLDTVPWISPEYFAERYPEQTARRAVYYWGFTLTLPARRRNRIFLAMLTAIGKVVSADRGVCGYDICAYNNATMELAHHIEQLSQQLTDVTFEVLDTQTYYCATIS